MARRKSSAERKKERKKQERESKEKAKTKKVSKEAIAEKTKKQSQFANLKLFGRWSNQVEIKDPGLAPYINLDPKIIPRSAGINQKRRFHKSKIHIVERLALHILIPGHSGKRHRITSGIFGGAYYRALNTVEKAFEIIEKSEKTNPLEILVRAIENASLCEEVFSYQLGSIMGRSAVITSPQRRVDKTLRYFAQGSYKSSFNKKRKIEEALANEIIKANFFESQSSSFER